LKRHAYLIIAHDKRHQLEQLLSLLDHPSNDIYLLINSQGDINSEGLSLKRSRLFILPPMPINWAAFTLVLGELMLLKAACKTGYHYYHMLSGSDLPLVDQKVIHDFLEDSDLEYVDFAPENYAFAHFKVDYYHFLVNLKMYRKYLIVRIIGHAFVKLQSILGINRTRKIKEQLYHGSAWFSITHAFANYLIQKEDWIKKTFHTTICSDEVFLQTILMSSPFKEKIYNCSTGKTQNLRYIDWKRRDKNSPYTFRKDDYEELREAGKRAFFARKFHSPLDNAIVDRIVDGLKNRMTL
jgi:hypothetical protein